MIHVSVPVLLLLLGLGAARLTRLVTDDEITRPLRLWVSERWGATGKMTYLVHCRWCSGIWVSAALSVFCWATGLCSWQVALLLVPAVAYAAALIRAMIEE